MGRRTTRIPLFVVWLLTLAVLAVAAALTVWNVRVIRQTSRIRTLLRPHLEEITLGMLLDERGAAPDEYEQIRACYEDPDSIDLHAVCWNLVSRPTPFFNNAPEPGSRADGTFNIQQLRGAEPVAISKPHGVFRIFLTGGSFAYSIGAPAEDRTIARLLEDRLNAAAGEGRRFEVWDAAVPAYASTHERIRITNQLLWLEPDLIVMLTGLNDCHWAFGGLDVMYLRAYADEEFMGLINAARTIGGADPYPPEPPVYRPEPLAVERVAERFAFNVRQTAAALQWRDVPLVVAFQPFLSPDTKELTPVEQRWTETDENREKIAYMGRAFDLMEARTRALLQPSGNGSWTPDRLHILNLRDAFAGRSDPMFIDLYHVADKGNAVVAGRLARELMQLGLLE